MLWVLHRVCRLLFLVPSKVDIPVVSIAFVPGQLDQEFTNRAVETERSVEVSDGVWKQKCPQCCVWVCHANLKQTPRAAPSTFHLQAYGFPLHLPSRVGPINLLRFPSASGVAASSTEITLGDLLTALWLAESRAVAFLASQNVHDLV